MDSEEGKEGNTIASQDPTKPETEEEKTAQALGTGAVRTDITGESHVQPDPIEDAIFGPHVCSPGG